MRITELTTWQIAIAVIAILLAGLVFAYLAWQILIIILVAIGLFILHEFFHFVRGE
jgi:hypothetical protein